MMAGLTAMIDSGSTVGKTFSKGDKSYKVSVLDNFSYTDPIDKSVSTKQVREACFTVCLVPIMTGKYGKSKWYWSRKNNGVRGFDKRVLDFARLKIFHQD